LKAGGWGFEADWQAKWFLVLKKVVKGNSQCRTFPDCVGFQTSFEDTNVDLEF